MATGGELIIDDSLFKSIERLDKALNALKDTSDEAGKGVVKFLKDLQGADITSFTKQLETMAQQYDFLNKTLKGKGEGFDKVAENASVAAVEVKALLDILKATDEYKRESAANKALSDSKEASEAIQRYKELSREIKNLQEIKKDASEFKDSSDAEIAKDAKRAYTESNKQLKALLAEQKNIEKNHADEVAQYKRDANMREFREKAQLAREAANAVEKEIERELAAREKALIKQINFEQKYSVRMDKMRELATSFEERVNKSVSDEERRENEEYLKELNRRIAEEQKYVERMRHLKEMAAKVDADALKQYEEDLKKTQEAHERTIAENAKFLQEYEARMRKLEEVRLRTADISDDALGYYNNLKSGKEVRSIQNMEKALSQLREAQKRLNLNTEEGKKRFKELGDAAEQVEKDINELTESIGKFKEGNSKLMDGIKDIGSSIALLFSVDAIKGYVDKLVDVRKELELQHRSLAVLIQDRQEADALWNQTMELAVKSPFRIKELVTYTKQLAAYRIETGKLHDTTKMLADVSAGLGVDMNRLILAYGQVRAAEYLRGTELRQFTEAGIPMLELLAEQMEKVKGKSVSTAEVFEMISKRMISFKQVDEVFKNITSSGGMFYQMQEKQSQTLSGMISNLHDSIDLMLNDIGKANDGILKSSISAAKIVVDNWEKIAEITKGLAAAFALYRYQLLLTNKALIRIAVATKIASKGTAQLKTVQLLQIGYAKLSKSITGAAKAMFAFAKSNPIILGVTAIAAAVYEISRVAIEHKKRIDEIEKKYKELGDTVNNITFDFNSAKQEGNIEKQKSKLEELIELANKKYKMEIEVDIKSLSQDEINKKYLEIEQRLIEAQAFAKNFELAFAKQQEWTLFDDILESMTKLSRTTSDYESTLITSSKNIAVALDRVLQQGGKLSENQTKALEMFKAPKNKDEDMSKYLERLASAYSLLGKEVKTFVVSSTYGVPTEAYKYPWKNTNITKAYESATNAISVFAYQTEYAKKKFDEFWNSLNLPEGISEGEKKIYIEAALDGLKSQENITQGVLDIIREQSYKKWEIPIMLTTGKSNDPILSSWQFAYNKLIEGIPELEKITDIHKTREDVIKEVNEEYTKQVDLLARIKKGSSKAYEGLSEEGTRGLVDKLQSIRDWFGVASKTTTSQKDWFSPMASSISDAHKEFIKLNKTLDNTAAKELTLAKYTKVFEEAARNAGLSDISLGQFKFETEQGTVDALNYLKELLPESAKQARLSIENALANITGEMTISDKVKQDKELIDYIESMFGNYEVSLEMEKLNIPPDLAQRLFGVESIDLSSIRSKIEEEIAKIGTDKGQEDLLKQLQDLLKKVDKLDEDALKERMKRYTEFLKKGQTERVKIKIEELRELSKLEEDYQKNKIGAADYSLAKKGIQDEAEKKLQSLEWDEFKESDTYIRMFEDLEYASKKSIEAIIERLKEMRENLKELSPTEIKEITNAIERLEDAAANKNPFASLVESIKPYISYLKEREELEERYSNSQKAEDNLKSVYKQEADNVSKLQVAYEKISKSKTATPEEKANAYVMLETAKQRAAFALDELEKQGLISEELAEQIRNGEKVKKTFKESLGEVASDANQVFSALPEIAGNLENVFGEMDAKTKDIVDSISAIGGGISSMAGNIASGNYIGALVDLTKVVGEFFKIGDKRREREIQRELKSVEKLSKEYEKLQKKIEDAFTLYDLQQSGKQSIDNLEKQKESYEKIIAAEEAKKKSDSDKIDEYKEKLEELEESIEETRNEVFSKATDGILDDVLSTAREFVDAWYDAFKETGDGMKGLEDNFNEMLLNMVKQQAAMTIVSPFIDRLKKKLEGYVNENDIDLDTDELTDLVSMSKNEFPVLAENLKKIFEAFKEAGLDTTQDTGELSGLQRGIQGITEETAQIIEAYLNAIRMTVVDNGSKMSSVISSLESISNSISNTMVGYLKTVAEQTSAINSLLEGVRTSNAQAIRVELIN
jgi:uncharacterized coiled-coil DUF342 family protein